MRFRQLKKQMKKEWNCTLVKKEVGLWNRHTELHEVDRDKYQERFCNLLEKIGYDNYGVKLTEEDGFIGEPNSNFIVRPYCWDDDSPDCELPNFECPSLKFKLTWYKYPLRGSYSNKELTDELMRKLEELC